MMMALQAQLLRPAILGVARHVLTLAAGALVARGYLDGAQAETLIGAGMGLAGVAWAVAAKRLP